MTIGTFNINYYGISLVLSILSGALYIFLNIRKDGYKNIENNILFFILYFSLIVFFGKIFTIITSSKELTLLDAGFSSYGGAIGAILASIIFERIISHDKKLIKYTIISLPLTYSIGKIGCFLGGCCYGIPYNGILSVTYTNGLNIPLFPIQLLESIVFLIIFIILNKLKNNKNIIYITIIISALSKFLLDFLRYDHLTKTITVNQIFSIILIFIILIILLFQNKKAISK